MENINLQCGCYYRINGTKKILYWDGESWRKPVKDKRGRYSGHSINIEKQPNVKSVQVAQESDLY